QGGVEAPRSVEDAVNLLSKVLDLFDPSKKGYVSEKDFTTVLLDLMGPDVSENDKLE
ncbi:unnamed protein product, partial [Heterosigma akashiwo]